MWKNMDYKQQLNMYYEMLCIGLVYMLWLMWETG